MEEIELEIFCCKCKTSIRIEDPRGLNDYHGYELLCHACSQKSAEESHQRANEKFNKIILKRVLHEKEIAKQAKTSENKSILEKKQNIV